MTKPARSERRDNMVKVALFVRLEENREKKLNLNVSFGGDCRSFRRN